MPQSVSTQSTDNLSVGSVIAILLYFLLVGGVGFWARGMATAVPGPGIIKTTPSGDVLVQVGNDLLRVTPQGTDVRTYNLESLGVARLFDFVPLGNQKILVRVGPYDKSLAQNIAMFLRLPNSSPLPRASTSRGLQVCDLGAMSCVPFSRNFDIDDVHWVARDPATGDVYVADTSRHRLYKFDANGDLIATKTTGFWFPNQIEVVGKTLRVVDTNHRVVELVDTHTASFGTLLRDETRVPDRVEALESRVFPVMQADIGDEHWLLVMNHKMMNGAVYRYTQNWHPLGPVVSPRAEADYVAPVGTGAWISDAEGLRVLEFDAQGNELGELQSPEFRQRMADLGGSESNWMKLVYAMGGLFVLSLLGGVALGARQTMRGPKALDGTQYQPVRVNLNDRSIYWIGSNPTARRTVYPGLVFTGVLWTFLLFWFVIKHAGAAPGSPAFKNRILLELAIPLIVVLLAVGFSTIRRYRIGILGDVLVLRRGQEYRAARGKSIIYSGMQVAIDNFVAPLGTAYMPLYRNEDIVTHFNPVIQNATLVDRRTMQRYMMRQMTKMQWILIIAAMLMLAVLQIYAN